MTDIIERATRAIYRAAAEGDLRPPERAERALRTVLIALETPDEDMVAAAESIGLGVAPGEAAAVWLAMMKNLKARCAV